MTKTRIVDDDSDSSCDNDGYSGSNLSGEADYVYKLLERLDTKDSEELAKAQTDVDEYLKSKQRKEDEEALKRQVELEIKNDAGGGRGGITKKGKSRTVINTKESEMERRRRLSEEFKSLGNASFGQGEWRRAIEYYTSAILQLDRNPIIFTNRAQAYLRIEEFDEATRDCKEAIKLHPGSIKARIHLAKAHKGNGEFQAAIDILEQAEDLSEDHTEVIRSYKQDVITAMKLFMLKYDKANKISEDCNEILDDEQFEIRLGEDEEEEESNSEITEEMLKSRQT